VLAGDPWSLRETWERLLVPDLLRQAGALLEEHRFPRDARARVIADLREGVFWFLVGGGEGISGFDELAVRTLETSGAGPVDALVPVAPDGVWATLASCGATHGHWPDTGARRWPGPRGARIALARRALATDAEAVFDLHAAARVCARWAEGADASVDGSWDAVAQNRGRARGRLRARLAPERAAVVAAVLELDALHSRTLAGWRRLCFAWLRLLMRGGFAGDALRGATPPCDGTSELVDPADPRLRTWVLLALLRGHHDRLVRWVRTGSTGDAASSWGRLLKQGLPDALRDPSTGRNATYHRLRAALADGLADALAAAAPTLEAVAGGAGSAALDAVWSPDVPRPGPAGLAASAARALAAMRAGEGA
jgi:hypothetical protein